MARQLQLCPDTTPGNRRMRSSGGPVGQRHLCLCGPGGGGGPTCGLCYGRALTGNLHDRCGGLTAPNQSLGLSFRVTRSISGGGTINITQGSATHFASSSALYADSFVIASRNNASGQCMPSMESWSGSGSATVESISAGWFGEFPYSGSAQASAPEWQALGLLGPPTFPQINTPLMGTIAFVQPMAGAPGVASCGAGQGSFCSFAYPRASLCAGLSVMARALIYMAVDALPGTPQPGGGALSSVGSMNGGFEGPGAFLIGSTTTANAPYSMTWFNQPCSGSQTYPTLPSGMVRSESWGNTQGGLTGSASWSVNWDDTTSPSTWVQHYQWTASITVEVLDPCPGDAPDRNAAAIAGFMAQGERAGCCG